LAGGRDGSGAPWLPPFPSLTIQLRQQLPSQVLEGPRRVFHSCDGIDFARFEGGTVGVLAASASAFDNAAVALDAGAREVRLFSPTAPAADQQVEMGGFLGLLSWLL